MVGLASFLQQITEFISKSTGMVAAWLSAASCADEAAREEGAGCQDDAAALRLKWVAMAAILVTGVAGVALPLVGARKRRAQRAAGGAAVVFVAVKAFAAGVILATGFVHILPDAERALSSPCLPAVPWRRFPFSGFVAMCAALATLVLDFLATMFHERKHREAAAALASSSSAITVLTVADDDEHTAPLLQTQSRVHAHGSAHSHGNELVQQDGEASAHVRFVVVSQILEMGIMSHSVIIGLSLGVSRSPCTIRPLVAALAFHQFFEGFALGGCVAQISKIPLHMRCYHSILLVSICFSNFKVALLPLYRSNFILLNSFGLIFHSWRNPIDTPYDIWQVCLRCVRGFLPLLPLFSAQFKKLSAAIMASFFAITTPAGIAVGVGVASFYDANSPRALAVEGILDSVSAGVLIYMSLVNLIAVDFLGGKTTGTLWQKVTAYFALFLGALSMSSLAIWS